MAARPGDHSGDFGDLLEQLLDLELALLDVVLVVLLGERVQGQHPAQQLLVQPDALREGLADHCVTVGVPCWADSSAMRLAPNSPRGCSWSSWAGISRLSTLMRGFEDEGAFYLDWRIEAVAASVANYRG